MINYKNLVRPPRSSGRASVSRRARSPKRARDSRLCRRRDKESKSCSFDLDPTEKAIEFRLLISHGGRTYCTKRTLLQIAQCRQNLVDNLEWEHRNDSPNRTLQEIPRVPRVGEGLFCGGFSQLDGILDCFKPTLESWFQDVLAIVSDENPILSDFLWEPLDCTCNRDTLHQSLTSLGSIKGSALSREFSLVGLELEHSRDSM